MDRNVFDAAPSQPPDDAAHFGSYRRPEFECAPELVVHRDHHHRVTFAVRIVQRCFDRA